LLEKTNVFFYRKKHFAPFSVATEGKSVLFFGKNVDFRPKQVCEKSQFSLISKAFFGKREFPFPKTAAFLFFFLPYIRARSVPKLEFQKIFFCKRSKSIDFSGFFYIRKNFLVFSK